MNEKLHIVIPSNPVECVNLLDEYAIDPFETLNFLAKVADQQGVYFDKESIEKELVRRYAEVN